MDALAALGIVLPITLIIQACANLIGLGGSPRAGIRMGEGRHEEANRIFNTAFFLLVLLGAVITFSFAYPIIVLFGCPSSAVGFAVSYLKIYACGTIFVILIPLCFILTHHMGFFGVYLSEGIADLVAGIITAIVIFTTFPRSGSGKRMSGARKVRRILILHTLQSYIHALLFFCHS